MTFVKGQAQLAGAGRLPGVPNKRTQVLEGLARVYGKNAEVAFWEQAARSARGMTAKEAVDNGLLESDKQLPCLHSFKMIADRLIPTLKPQEVPMPALGEGKQLSDTELTERLVSQLIKQADSELVKGLITSQNTLPSQASAPNTPKIAGITSIVDISEEEAKDEQEHELEAKE